MQFIVGKVTIMSEVSANMCLTWHRLFAVDRDPRVDRSRNAAGCHLLRYSVVKQSFANIIHFDFPVLL